VSDGFAIHQLRAGGGWLGICPLPRAEDMGTLKDWAPDLVLSMTETDEMVQLGGGGLGEILGEAGITWHHLPIRDFGAPPEELQAVWPAVSAQARGILANGGKVLAHCRGGCGRSGMVLLRLMVELGETPEAALARLREVRPCAVETEGQHAWASGP
jgi:protein-tyrosine phosphatase